MYFISSIKCSTTFYTTHPKRAERNNNIIENLGVQSLCTEIYPLFLNLNFGAPQMSWIRINRKLQINRVLQISKMKREGLMCPGLLYLLVHYVLIVLIRFTKPDITHFPINHTPYSFTPKSFHPTIPHSIFLKSPIMDILIKIQNHKF